MKLILDTRENQLKDILSTLVKEEKHLEIKPLDIGDIVIVDDNDKELAIIERKSVSDLLSSIKDGRYKEQSHRLSSYSGLCNHNIIYLIEGKLPKIDSNLVLSSITSLLYFKGFSVLRTFSLDETTKLVTSMFYKIEKETKLGKQPYIETRENAIGDSNNESYCSFVKKKKSDNITEDNFLEIILCQIPGVGPKIATSISKNFDNLESLLKSLKDDKGTISNIKSSNRKVGLKIEEKIYTFLIKSADK